MSAIPTPWGATATAAVITAFAMGAAAYSTHSDTIGRRQADSLVASVHLDGKMPAAKSVERATAKPGEPGMDPRPSAPLAVQARSLIFTGTVTLRVPKVDNAAMMVNRLTTGADGFISEDDRVGGNTNYRAKLALRVPSSHF